VFGSSSRSAFEDGRRMGPLGVAAWLAPGPLPHHRHAPRHKQTNTGNPRGPCKKTRTRALVPNIIRSEGHSRRAGVLGIEDRWAPPHRAWHVERAVLALGPSNPGASLGRSVLAGCRIKRPEKRQAPNRPATFPGSPRALMRNAIAGFEAKRSEKNPGGPARRARPGAPEGEVAGGS